MTYLRFQLRPNRTLRPDPQGHARQVRMTIQPGGFDDPSQGWTGGYATRDNTGSVYLNCEFVVMEGEYARRKMWSLIGLHSPKGPEWANMGRTSCGILNSARGISDRTVCRRRTRAASAGSPISTASSSSARSTGQGPERPGQERHPRRITPDHKDYAALMGLARRPSGEGAGAQRHAPRRPTARPLPLPAAAPAAVPPVPRPPAGRSKGGRRHDASPPPSPWSSAPGGARPATATPWRCPTGSGKTIMLSAVAGSLLASPMPRPASSPTARADRPEPGQVCAG